MSLANAFVIYKLIRMLVTSWENTDAFKLGLIDDKGKSIRKAKTSEEKGAMDMLTRLVFNLKRIFQKLPVVGKLGTYLGALFLLKEETGLDDDSIMQILDEAGIELNTVSLMEAEQKSKWMLDAEDNSIMPGVYTLRHDIYTSGSFIARENSEVIIDENTQPVGDVCGYDIYSVRHKKSNLQVYISLLDIKR